MIKKIKIGTQMWEIVERSSKKDSELNEGTYGYTMDKHNQIVIDQDMPVSRKRTTLLHEVLHAIRFTYGGSTVPSKGTSYMDWEHHFIGIWEEPLVTVLQENPEFADFLLGKND